MLIEAFFPWGVVAVEHFFGQLARRVFQLGIRLILLGQGRHTGRARAAFVRRTTAAPSAPSSSTLTIVAAVARRLGFSTTVSATFGIAKVEVVADGKLAIAFVGIGQRALGATLIASRGWAAFAITAAAASTAATAAAAAVALLGGFFGTIGLRRAIGRRFGIVKRRFDI